VSRTALAVNTTAFAVDISAFAVNISVFAVSVSALEVYGSAFSVGISALGVSVSAFGGGSCEKTVRSCVFAESSWLLTVCGSYMVTALNIKELICLYCGLVAP
jgi:hypothetical protein